MKVIRLLISVPFLLIGSINVVAIEPTADTISKTVNIEKTIKQLNEDAKIMRVTINNHQQSITQLQDEIGDQKPSSLPLFLSVFAIFIAVTDLLLLLRICKNPKQSKQKDAEGEADTKFRFYQEEMGRLKGEQENISERLSQLEAMVKKLVEKKSAPPNLTNQQKNQSEQSSVVRPQIGGVSFRKEVKYAESLEGDSIFVDDLKDTNSEYALLKVTITSPTEAFFEVNDMTQAQPMLVSSYKFLIANFVNSYSNSSSPKQIRTKKVGKLRLQGEYWKLEQKADIVLE